MNTVENLYEVRADGKVMREGITSEQLHALGEISKVIEVYWTCSATKQIASLKAPFGVFATVVQGRRFLAATVYSNESESNLVIVNPDGTIRFIVSQVQQLNGGKEQGVFDWIDKPFEAREGVFGAIFRVDSFPASQYWLDIDAATGQVLGNRSTK